MNHIVAIMLVTCIPLVSSCSYDYKTQCKINYQICITGTPINQTCDCFEPLVSCFNDQKCVDNRTLILLEGECEKFFCRSNCTFEDNDNSDAIVIGIVLGITIPIGLLLLALVGIVIYIYVSDYRDEHRVPLGEGGFIPGANCITNRDDVEMGSDSESDRPSSHSEQNDISDDEN